MARRKQHDLNCRSAGISWPTTSLTEDSGGEADPATRGSDTQEEQNLQNRLTKDWDQVLLQSSGRDPQPVGDNWANSSQVNIMSGPSPWGTEVEDYGVTSPINRKGGPKNPWTITARLALHYGFGTLRHKTLRSRHGSLLK
ncbi:hypothetical protein M0657_003213 [Pyricularia oryzae]|uniref:Uncharacterized protein n=1 Tax=Pyricularia oryzae TaxID=318829 RepID=A0A4P7MZA9_PYROR|nr:hypothetical protein M9X92_005930 [Pyricularia oryzae]KAI7927391.1 hypothetical protein M0657_003213 [Pyricularia oryzae]QBZ54412.1 hypothetical protein PoMZ_10112 [Pyricularia oryzae]